MSISDYILIFIFIGILVTYFLLWSRDRRRQFDIEREKIEIERRREMERRDRETDNYYRQKDMNEEIINQLRESIISQQAGSGAGGYIILNIPDEQKSAFYDLLKGFEEYAKLKGYQINFSLDSSIPNSVAFKFTILNSGISVSPSIVKNDIEEYIHKVKDNDDFEDMPTVLSEGEHSLTLTKLKNRVNLLKNNLDLEKNARLFYEKLLNKIADSNTGIFPSQSIILNSGGDFTNMSNKLIGSRNVNIGDKNLIEDSSVIIGNSFNQIKEQVKGLGLLIEAMKKDDSADEDTKAKSIINLEKVKSELEDEEKPDKGKIKKWLEKAKDFMHLAKFGQEVFNTAKEIYKSFGLDSLF